jgi:hypothetical protein
MRRAKSSAASFAGCGEGVFLGLFGLAGLKSILSFRGGSRPI